MDWVLEANRVSRAASNQLPVGSYRASSGTGVSVGQVPGKT